MFIIINFLRSLYYEGECVLDYSLQDNNKIQVVINNKELLCRRLISEECGEDVNIDSVIADLIINSIKSYPLKSNISIINPTKLPTPHNDENSIHNLNIIYNKIVAMLNYFDSPEMKFYASRELSSTSVKDILMTYLIDDFNKPQQGDIESMFLELSSKLYLAFSKYFEQRGTLFYDVLSEYASSNKRGLLEEQDVASANYKKLRKDISR